jgi:rubrerythrin
MVGELFAGLSALKAALDMSQTLSNIHDVTTRDRAIIELQKEILSAQAAQIGLIERVGELEKEVANFETRAAEKQRYELKDLEWGAFAHMLKPAERGISPPHWVCTNCYEHRHIATLQHPMVQGRAQVWKCPSCNSEITPGTTLRWID